MKLEEAVQVVIRFQICIFDTLNTATFVQIGGKWQL